MNRRLLIKVPMRRAESTIAVRHTPLARETVTAGFSQQRAVR